MMTAVSSQTSGHELGLKPTVSSYVATVDDFFQLMKPRVMSLVVFTGFAGMYLAPGEMHLGLALVSLFAIAAGAGASGAINQWYDRDIDQIMSRTRNRPIPAGKVDPAEALALGVVVSVLSVLLLSLKASCENPLQQFGRRFELKPGNFIVPTLTCGTPSLHVGKFLPMSTQL